MIIIGIMGGLGNQMFQYALYRKFLSLGKDVKLDISSFSVKQEFRHFELDTFGVPYELADPKDILRLGNSYSSLIGKIRGKLGISKRSVYQENLDLGYQPVIFDMDNVYLDGYWQAEQYFSDIREELLSLFRFPLPLNHENEEILKQIRSGPSVSIHVRRGDYLSTENSPVYGNICTIEYYKKAIRHAREHFRGVTFFLFTNDPDWVRQNLYENDMVIVDCNKGDNAVYDMYLMSQCDGNIVANSSFSWWGAWLNQHTPKFVLSPYKWRNRHDVRDTICADWIKID